MADSPKPGLEWPTVEELRRASLEYPDPLASDQPDPAVAPPNPSQTRPRSDGLPPVERDPVSNYAPTGPDEDLVLHPNMSGYSGFSRRIWWAAAFVAFVLAMIFAWKSGFFGSGKTAGTTVSSATSTGASVSPSTPGPNSAGFANVNNQSDALPVVTSHPWRMNKNAPSATAKSTPYPSGAYPQGQTSDYNPPSSYTNAQFAPAMRTVSTTAGGQSTVPDPAFFTQGAPQTPAPINDTTGSQTATAPALIAEDTTASVQANVLTTGAGTNGSSLSGGTTTTGTATDVPDASDGPTYSLWAGDVIPAILDTGVVSDLSGTVVAHVERNVYDSKTGEYLLIPAGARIVGSYVGGGGIQQGQSRLGITWNLLILPSGHPIDLGSLEAADLSGNTGLPAHVDTHNGRVFKTTALLGLLGGLASLGNNNSAAPNAWNTIGGAQAQQFAQTGSSVIQQQSQIPPTLTVQKGTSFMILLNRTFALPEYAGEATQ